MHVPIQNNKLHVKGSDVGIVVQAENSVRVRVEEIEVAHCTGFEKNNRISILCRHKYLNLVLSNFSLYDKMDFDY